MKKLLSLTFVLLIALLFSCTTKKNEPAISIPFEKYTLANGLTVILHEDKSDPIAAVAVVFHVGSSREAEGKTGFAHLFEHMMFRGTERYSKAAYNDVLKSIGADNNAFTTDDYTAYHTLASAAALETIMDVEADRFMNLKYSVEDFKTEAGAILEAAGGLPLPKQERGFGELAPIVKKQPPPQRGAGTLAILKFLGANTLKLRYEEGENVIYRKHWVVLVLQAWMPVVGTLGSLLIFLARLVHLAFIPEEALLSHSRAA